MFGQHNSPGIRPQTRGSHQRHPSLDLSDVLENSDPTQYPDNNPTHSRERQCDGRLPKPHGEEPHRVEVEPRNSAELDTEGSQLK